MNERQNESGSELTNDMLTGQKRRAQHAGVVAQ